MTIALLQLRLSDAAAGRIPSVAVVDITGLLQVRAGTPNHEELVTPRRELGEIVNAVAAANPSAIGVDIIFRPDDRGHISDEEERFLDLCLNTTGPSGNHIPTFVGIQESIVRGPKGWLGEERFGPLGAAVVVPRSEGAEPTTRMPSSLTLPGPDGAILAPSLSYALARARATEDTSKRWLGHSLHQHLPSLVESDIRNDGQLIQAREFDVDFGGTSQIIATTVHAVSAEDVKPQLGRLAKKVVLIGRGMSDQFNVPGQGTPVAGAYVHAAAVNTLLASPLYRLTHVGRILADIFAALIPLTILFVAEWSYKKERPTPASETPAKLLSIGVAAAIVIFGYFWIDWTGIFWTDFLLVIFAVLLHPRIEQFIDHVREIAQSERSH
jgi:hypothetical protein